MLSYPRRQHAYGSSNAAATLTSSSEWVQKALNPAHGVLGAVAIPDTAAQVTACGEWRCNFNLTPSVLDTSVATWDVDILVTGNGTLPLAWRAHASGSAWSGPTNGWSALSYPSFPTGDPANLRQVDQVRSTFLGVTLYFNAPALSNQGRLIAGQVPNPYTLVNQSVSERDPEAAARRLMAAYRENSVSSLAEAIKTNAALSQLVVQELVPLSEEELVQYSPQTYVGLAKAGCYVPVKFIQPVHNFMDVESNLGSLNWRLSDGTLSPVLGGTSYWPVIAGINTQTTVILLRGIDKSASLMLKLRQGFEAVCSPDSVLSAFQYETVIADPLALTAVASAQQVTPSAYPAAANDFLGVLRSIGRALTGRVAQGIAGFLQKAGIPVLSPLAGPVQGVMQAANGLL